MENIDIINIFYSEPKPVLRRYIQIIKDYHTHIFLDFSESESEMYGESMGSTQNSWTHVHESRNENMGK